MKIHLAKLHEGINQLGFQIKPAELGFDEKAETQFLFPNDTCADVEIHKFGEKYFIHVHLITLAHYSCDRCLEEYDRDLTADFQLVYSKEERVVAVDDDDFRLLGDKQTEIDLRDDIRENILLVIPMKHLCDEECKGLCPQCGTNLNFDRCNCHETRIDPRWEILKMLQSN